LPGLQKIKESAQYTLCTQVEYFVTNFSLLKEVAKKRTNGKVLAVEGAAVNFLIPLVALLCF